MTNEEAIKILKKARLAGIVDVDINRTLDMAIKALEQEPCDVIKCKVVKALQALEEPQEDCDCISREDAFVIIESAYEECKIGYTDYIEMRDAVKDALSVKPQRAKGHWSDECECSVCGNQPWYEGSTFRKNYKFCPYCGADMRGSDEE